MALILGLATVAGGAPAEEGAWDKTRSGAKESWSGIKQGSKELWGGVKEGSKEAAGGAREGAKSVWRSFKDVFDAQ